MTTQVFRHDASKRVEAGFDFTVLCCEGDVGRGGRFELPLPPAANGAPAMTMVVERARGSIKRGPGLVEIHGRLGDEAGTPVRLTRRIAASGFEFVLAG